MNRVSRGWRWRTALSTCTCAQISARAGVGEVCARLLVCPSRGPPAGTGGGDGGRERECVCAAHPHTHHCCRGVATQRGRWRVFHLVMREALTRSMSRIEDENLLLLQGVELLPRHEHEGPAPPLCCRSSARRRSRSKRKRRRPDHRECAELEGAASRTPPCSDQRASACEERSRARQIPAGRVIRCAVSTLHRPRRRLPATRTCLLSSAHSLWFVTFRSTRHP